MSQDEQEALAPPSFRSLREIRRCSAANSAAARTDWIFDENSQWWAPYNSVPIGCRSPAKICIFDTRKTKRLLSIDRGTTNGRTQTFECHNPILRHYSLARLQAWGVRKTYALRSSIRARRPWKGFHDSKETCSRVVIAYLYQICRRH
jgi:hypothetical protein